MSKTRTSPNPDQIDLLGWLDELNEERDRVEHTNAERAQRRGYLIFATDPNIHPDEPGYRQVFATEAKTPGQAVAKTRPLAPGRRFRAYLATGTYSHELADARWIP